MAPSSVHERCSLRQRYLDRFKGLGLRPLSADVAAGHPCIESVEHIVYRRACPLRIKPPNGQRNRPSQAIGFTVRALYALNRQMDAAKPKTAESFVLLRATRPTRQTQRRDFRGDRAGGEGGGDERHRQKRHTGDEHARCERPERAAKLQ